MNNFILYILTKCQGLGVKFYYKIPKFVQNLYLLLKFIIGFMIISTTERNGVDHGSAQVRQ